MIVRPRPNLLALFLVWRGSVIRHIWPQVVGVFLISASVVWCHRHVPEYVPSMNAAPFSLLGIALSIFLGFRNSACYDRWWEGRKQWGAVLVAARDLSRQSQMLVTPSAGEPQGDAQGLAERRNMLLGVACFAQLFVRHLRPGAMPGPLPLPDSHPLLLFPGPNRPEAVLRGMGAQVARLAAEGRLSDIRYQMLDASLAQLSLILASCERIRNTPVPFGYTLLLHRTAHMFCFMLPFGFADLLGWITPFAAAVVAYTFFGLDALGDELEEPFGRSPNDLPIETLARIVEIDMRAALGETELPEMPRPKGFLLM